LLTVVPLECVDLEIDKTICNIPNIPTIGDTMSYCIEICNVRDPNIGLQYDAHDVKVGDTWPPQLSYVDYTATQGTFVYATPEGTWSIPNLASGTCETITIRGKILDYGSVQNITEVTDSGREDVDSDEDNDDGDQSEDDEDIETFEVKVFDLALTKEICPTQVLPITNLGQTVDYCMTITNQGGVNAYNIELTDYLPAEVTLADPDWIDNLDGTATYQYIDSIPVGQMVTVQLTTTLSTIPTGPVVNVSEISEYEDADGDTPPDVDSNADPDPNNDGPMDDGTTDNSNGDEDDSDPASFYPEIVDLALKKTRVGSGPVSIGDDITYNITIYNQGNVSATNILVNEYIPAGLALNAGLSPGWMASGTDATYTITSLLTQGDSIVIPITMTVQPGANATNLRNVSEIGSFEDDSGTDITNMGFSIEKSNHDSSDLYLWSGS